MLVFDNKASGDQLEEIFRDKYVIVFADNINKVLVCQTQVTYIPIESFQAVFLKCSELVGQYGIQRFIFDKRSLRAFHQPSMEWYFVIWKQEMFHLHGLRVHRKILPPEPWFQKCVEAGRNEIEQKHPKNVFSKLDIAYARDLAEALRM